MNESPRSFSLIEVLANVVRGGLIGLAELVPGVSGGTIALITGVYERALAAGNKLISAVKRLIVGPQRWKAFRAELREVDWQLVLPLILGMATMVLALAGVMASFVQNSPTLSKGLFLGMVLASVAVPLLLVRLTEVQRSHWLGYAGVFLVTAVTAYLLTSSGGGSQLSDPNYLLVFAAAAVAVCALALPGVSGSFFLLVIGLYAPTLAAVHERNLSYVAVFTLGAITGVVLFVRALGWLLEHHHSGVMFAMSGLLLGSLRALWPWQDTTGALLPPAADWLPVTGLAILGVVLVVALVLADRRLSAKTAAPTESVEPTGEARV